jgi:hypothetical protein
MRTQGSLVPRNPYMFSSMSDFASVVCSFGESPLGGLWNEGERSEPSGTTRPAAGGGPASCPAGVRIPATLRCWLRFPFLLSLLRQGTEAGTPAQGAPAMCASSCNPRMACSQSVAQLEPPHFQCSKLEPLLERRLWSQVRRHKAELDHTYPPLTDPYYEKKSRSRLCRNGCRQSDASSPSQWPSIRVQQRR